MPKKPYCVNVHDLPRQSRFGGMLGETAVLMDHAMLKFSWAQPFSGDMTGRSAPKGEPHSHPWDQAIFLVSGKVEVTLGEEGEHGVYVLEPGSIIYIPADIPHIGRVLSEEPSFGVDIFAPPVEEYMDMAEHHLAHERGDDA